MIKIFLLAISFNLMYMSCGKNQLPHVPVCIQQRIEAIKKQPKWNPPAEIHEYRYNGKRVFLITADCCDQYITLVDENCTTICAPSGGISGKGDLQCPDFYEKAEYKRLVWKDDRK